MTASVSTKRPGCQAYVLQRHSGAMWCGVREEYILSTRTESNGNPAGSIHRHDGVTPAERYLKRLCDHSFLSLWSYSGVYRDQWLNRTVKEDKEVTDLLVVFENHIIIFSDKDCVYPHGDDQELNWRRWFRRAVQESAKQIWGAERWIKTNPQRLFLDHACTQPFPITLLIHRRQRSIASLSLMESQSDAARS